MHISIKTVINGNSGTVGEGVGVLVGVTVGFGVDEVEEEDDDELDDEDEELDSIFSQNLIALNVDEKFYFLDDNKTLLLSCFVLS